MTKRKSSAYFLKEEGPSGGGKRLRLIVTAFKAIKATTTTSATFQAKLPKTVAGSLPDYIFSTSDEACYAELQKDGKTFAWSRDILTEK